MDSWSPRSNQYLLYSLSIKGFDWNDNMITFKPLVSRDWWKRVKILFFFPERLWPRKVWGEVPVFCDILLTIFLFFSLLSLWDTQSLWKYLLWLKTTSHLFKDWYFQFSVHVRIYQALKQDWSYSFLFMDN